MTEDIKDKIIELLTENNKLQDEINYHYRETEKLNIQMKSNNKKIAQLRANLK